MGKSDYFGPEIAADYDADLAEMFRSSVVEPAVDLLADLAKDGEALELGIGTGRLALPLTQRGVAVKGIDLSQAMVDQMREKPGGSDIEVAIGDFATTKVPGTFCLVYLAFNTINNLTIQAEQVACFRNAAAHLKPGGCFLIEVNMPRLQALSPGETIVPFRVEEDRWGFDEYDVANQGLISHHFKVVGDKLKRESIPFRYVWPAELDLMAQMADMTLKHRWGGWTRDPFTSDSEKHISLWEKA